MTQQYKPPGVPIEADTPGFNEWGIPWHACAGYRHDEHYWAWVAANNATRGDPWYAADDPRRLTSGGALGSADHEIETPRTR